MNDLQDLTTLVRAATPLIVIETVDEQRVIECFRHVITQALRPLWRWTLTEGLVRLDFGDGGVPVPPDASTTLEAIRGTGQAGIYLLFDFQRFLDYAMTARVLREIVQRQRSAAHTLVLVGARVDLPPELQPLATPVRLALPDRHAMAALVKAEVAGWERQQGRRLEVDVEAAREIVRHLVGLTAADARRIVRRLIHADDALGRADLPRLLKAKFELLNRSGLLQYEVETCDFDEVAGLQRLRQWVERRRAAFLGRPLPGGMRLDPPRGVLLLGVQGCGKSLAARAIAGTLGAALLRLDFGTLYNKYHGETERNLREALESVAQLAPCVLWIDEIEKGLADGGSDDGVSRRVLGYLLTWMAERPAPVFIVATANQVDALPPELLRKGRFDEIFFVDLPDADGRARIFALHLRQRGLDPAMFELPALAAASEGFSGAEIEQAVVSGLYDSLGGSGVLDQPILMAALAATRPLSVVMREPVQALRAWASGRCVPAG